MNTYLLAFLGGAILNLMPCVFPVLGIKVLGFANQAGSSRRAMTLHALTFTVGVVISFITLAAVLAALRASGEQFGWGFQLQSPGFVYALAVVMLVFAMSLSGVFEIGHRVTGLGGALHTLQGYAGSLATGALATVVATPCSAPFLAPALGAALALPVGESFAVFATIGVGLSFPYLLLTLLPAAIRVLPRPGRWMDTVKQLMAFPLYATVGWLVWVLAGQTTPNALLGMLMGLVVIAMGCWVYGRFAGLHATARHLALGSGGAVALIVAGLCLGYPRPETPTEITWEPWSTERVAALTAAGTPVYVDFTARWCATCQANEKVAFASDEVRRYFKSHHVVALKADWTNSDARITTELARWNRSAVPFNLVYLPARSAPIVLPEVLTPGIVLGAFHSTP